ncbi:MAG: hypothetical protein WCD04_13425 [Terriglobia bacterium]|jgi:hypothetical protein
MSQAESTDRLPPGVEAQGTAKKPYQKPEVRHERVFETRALTCGKVQATQGQCHFNRRIS